MFLKKLFGGKSEGGQSAKKKSSGFFLELDDEDNQVAQAVDTVASKVGSATSTAVDTVKSTVSQVVDEVKSDTESAPPAPKPAENKQNKQKSEKEQQKTVKEKAKTKQTAQPTAPAQILQEKIPTSVKPDTNGQEEPKSTTFAPQYLMPTTTQPRRRPGPSMETFKDMARQVKTPKPKQ